MKLETCAMAVVLCENKILTISELIFGRKVLSLPKGHQERGEDIVDTAIRECFEETNISLQTDNLSSALTPYSYNFTLPTGQLICKTVHPFLFLIDDFGTPLAKEETMISVDWMEIDEFLKCCTYDSVRKVVNDIMIKI